MINSKFSSCSETQSGGDEEFSFHEITAPPPALGHESAFGFNRACVGPRHTQDRPPRSGDLNLQTSQHSRFGS